MRTTPTTSALTIACATLLLAACDEPTTSPAGLREADAALATPARGTGASAASALVAAGAPFTVRAPLDPYFINQMPDFMIRSHVRSDLVMQRLVTPPSEGVWHTHPGPSFGIVEQGRVMITRVTRRGCVSEVYGPGDPNGAAYFEVADEVHRATVLGPTDAVEYKVRFNTPVGAPLSTVVGAPGC